MRKSFKMKLYDGMGKEYEKRHNELWDDMHLLPFDGIGDWGRIAKQLKEFNFTEILCLEVRNTYYKNDSVEDFFKKAYSYATEFTGLLKDYRK